MPRLETTLEFGPLGERPVYVDFDYQGGEEPDRDTGYPGCDESVDICYATVNINGSYQSFLGSADPVELDDLEVLCLEMIHDNAQGWLDAIGEAQHNDRIEREMERLEDMCQ